MTGALSRRRFLTITAAAALTPGAAVAASSTSRWRGVALGAPATIQLTGLDGADAAPIFKASEAEIARLEALFSLYRADSELSRLNRLGELRRPSPEMLELLSLSGAIHAASAGAFDPTVQPLWRVYAKAKGVAPDAEALVAARSSLGWRHVEISVDVVRFSHPGMALTLNGIAQGYIADRVADLMRGRGLRDVLIDTGEVAAMGLRPDGSPWRAGIATPDGALHGEVALTGRALATSSPTGTLLNAAGDGHILDPRTGAPGGKWRVASVSADLAAVADGLSTAFCLMDMEGINQALRAFPDAHVEMLS